jgi:hypothetical protein
LNSSRIAWWPRPICLAAAIPDHGCQLLSRFQTHQSPHLRLPASRLFAAVTPVAFSMRQRPVAFVTKIVRQCAASPVCRRRDLRLIGLASLYKYNESNLFKQELDTDSDFGFLYRSVLLTNFKSSVTNPGLFATLRLRANVNAMLALRFRQCT